jgi:hypothetical protein
VSVVLVALGSGVVDAATWHINPAGTGDASTLQAAIDLASSGDTIVLAPGIYRDRVTRTLHGSDAVAVAFLKGGLTIEGQEGPLATFIDGEEDHHCLVGEDLDEQTKLNGLTLIHGDALDESSPSGRRGGGLLLYESSPELREIRFVGCNSLDGGGGLHASGASGSQPLGVYECAFIYCWSGGPGGGAELIDVEDADLQRNTFAGNFSEMRGGGLAVDDASVRVDNNVWWLNCAHEEGGPLWCEQADAAVECNVFWQNFPEIDESRGCGADVGVGARPNTIADPMFCDVNSEDFTIHEQSPAAEANSGSCGQIGAYPSACGGGPGPVSSDLAHGTLQVRVCPNPTAAPSRLEVTGELAAGALVEIIDVGGRRIRRLGRARDATSPVVWDGRDDAGRRVVEGMYFARASAGDRSAVTRVVVRRRR